MISPSSVMPISVRGAGVNRDGSPVIRLKEKDGRVRALIGVSIEGVVEMALIDIDGVKLFKALE